MEKMVILSLTTAIYSVKSMRNAFDCFTPQRTEVGYLGAQ